MKDWMDVLRVHVCSNVWLGGSEEVDSTELAGEKQQVQFENEWLKSKLSVMDSRNEWLKSKLSEMDSRNEWLKSKLSVMDSRNEWLKSKLSVMDSRNEWLKSKLSVMDSQTKQWDSVCFENNKLKTKQAKQDETL